MVFESGATKFFTAVLFLPLAPWPAVEPEPTPAKLDLEGNCPVARRALVGARQRVYVPVTYWMALMGLISGYLTAIFAMDSIACEDTTECKNYSKLEWAFSQDNAMQVLNTWTAKGRAAMALSAGLHIFSSFLFAQIFIVGGLALRERFMALGQLRLSRAATVVPFLGRAFNVLYCTVHCLNASTVVGGAPSASVPVVVGVLLVIALALLVVCALFVIGGAAYLLVRCCVGYKRCPSNDVALTANSPHDSSIVPPVTATVVLAHRA